MAFYKDGIISIPSVTGDIVIRATAVQSGPAYTNLVDTTESTNPTNVKDTRWKTNYRYSSSGISSETGTTICNQIKVSVGDVVRIKGVTFRSAQDRFALIGATSGQYLNYVSGLPSTYLGYTTETGGVHVFTVLSIPQGHSGDEYLSFAFQTPSSLGDIIITRNEEIS